MKKTFALILAMVLMMSLAATAIGEPVSEFAGYPIQTDETLTVYLAAGVERNSEYADYNTWPFFSYLEEGSGVHVEYSAPVEGADANQAFNLLLASGDLPDIIYVGGLPAKCETLIADGYMITLDEYIEEYAPNLYARVTADEVLNKSVKTDSGHYYAFPFLRDEVTYLGSFVGASVHKGMLDELGMDVPVTLEDWDEFLHAAKEQGLCDIGIGGNSLVRIRGIFSNALGFNGMDTYYVEDGVVKTWMNHEKYYDLMVMLSGWMADGLIDPDIITIDSATFYQKIVAQRYAACYKGSGAVQGYYDAVAERDGGFKYVAAPYPVENEGDEILFNQGEAAWVGTGAFITTACDNIELAMRWLDYSYTDEGIDTWNYGKKGVSYEIGEDGLPYYTELITEANEPLREATGRYVGMNGNGWSIMRVHFDQIRNPAVATEFVKVWTANTENAPKYRLSTLTATDAEAAELADLETALTTYANEMFVSFLIGSESMDNFDEYLANLDELQIDRVLEIKQEQYDRFNAR